MKEIWKDIKDFEGLYQISNLGRVKSLKRIVNGNGRNNSVRVLNERIRKLYVNSRLQYNGDGYYSTILCKEGKMYYFEIHRLIAEAFIPNPDNKPYINHINGIKSDIRIENLEWCTPKENSQHASKYNLLKKQIGELNGMSKLTEAQVIEIRKLKGKMYHKDIADLFGVKRTTITMILNNKIWTHRK